jgi:sodium/proline symporter
MAGDNIGIIIAFFLYIGVMITIGIIYYRKTNNVSDYILGGRGLNSWVTSMSAEASDMSGWLLLGLPGYAYLAGIQASWIAIGLAIGTYLNWKITAKRLRIYTHVASDSLTLPDFLQNRFHEKSKLIGLVMSIFILIFFLIYTSAQFVAGGKLFSTVFGLDYTLSMFIGAFIVVSYTFMGGFMAVCWTDFIQGILMFFAILLVPITALFVLGGPGETISAITSLNPELLNPFSNPDGSPVTFIAIVSLMAWGLGYFGQPHILVRFMAIKSSENLAKSRHIAMVWVILSLSAAVAIGLIGRVFLTKELDGAASETVFMVMTDQLFFSFLAGIVLSGILAAIMSTASSQLLVTATAVSQDIYKSLLRKNAGEKEQVWASRFAVLLVAAVAFFLGLNPENKVLDLVAYAWAGFGATFGPTLLFALFWRRMNRHGALAGIVAGGVTVLLWKNFGWIDLYEIVPGFIISCLAIYIVSIMTAPPSEAVVAEFDKAKADSV